MTLLQPIMGKIGILTFHNNENRGAILQAYSLQKSLDNIFNSDVEIIDYRTSSKEKARKNEIIISERPWKVVSRYNDHGLIENFLQEELPISESSITTDEHKKAIDWLNKQEYDIIFTGSDEIWKIPLNHGNGFFSRFYHKRPFPNLYFLDPEVSATKVAYAASSNETDLEQLSESQRRNLAKLLASYDSISVRDNHTENLVDELELKAHRVPDPTLLTELPIRDVEGLLIENGINPDEPILGFHATHNDLFKKICEEYRKRGFQIISCTNSKYADLELPGKVDPFEYFSVYEYFDMMVTSSLHSTIFSMKHGNPFVTIDVNEAYSDMESKTFSLLEDCSMLPRHIDAVDNDSVEFLSQLDRYESQPDIDSINNTLKQQKQKGINYLRSVKKKYE